MTLDLATRMNAIGGRQVGATRATNRAGALLAGVLFVSSSSGCYRGGLTGDVPLVAPVDALLLSADKPWVSPSPSREIVLLLLVSVTLSGGKDGLGGPARGAELELLDSRDAVVATLKSSIDGKALLRQKFLPGRYLLRPKGCPQAAQKLEHKSGSPLEVQILVPSKC